MSLITVNTVEINNQSNNKLVALNAGMISFLKRKESGSYFKFTPKTGREFWYFVREEESFILSAIHENTSFTLSLSTTAGSVTLNTENIIMAYRHPSEDRIWVRYISNNDILLLIAKYRLDDFVGMVNAERTRYTDSEAVTSFGNRVLEITTGVYTNTSLKDINMLILNKIGGDITLNGFADGVDYQIVFCVCFFKINNIHVINNSGAAAIGNKIATYTFANDSITAGNVGGFVMIYYSDYWRILEELT